MSTNLIVTIVVSLMVGGAAGAGVTRFVQPTPAPPPTPACPPAPAPQAHQDDQWHKFISVPPLTYQGKTYR